LLKRIAELLNCNLFIAVLMDFMVFTSGINCFYPDIENWSICSWEMWWSDVVFIENSFLVLSLLLRGGVFFQQF